MHVIIKWIISGQWRQPATTSWLPPSLRGLELRGARSAQRSFSERDDLAQALASVERVKGSWTIQQKQGFNCGLQGLILVIIGFDYSFWLTIVLIHSLTNHS